MRHALLFALLLAACSSEAPGDLDATDTEDGDSGSSGSSGGEDDSVSSRSTGDVSSEVTSAGTGDDSGGSSDSGGERQGPELVFITEFEPSSYTSCVDVIHTGDGSAVATYFVEGIFGTSGDTMALDADGEVTKVAVTLDNRYLVGLRSRTADLFEWVASDGTTGIADGELAIQTGESLGPDVIAAHGIAYRGDHAVVLVERPGGICTVRRLGAAPNDSVAVPCPNLFWPERHHLSVDGLGNAFVFDLEEDSVIRIDTAGAQWGSFMGTDLRRPYGAAATSEGELWFVGDLDTSLVFGSTFIAKHDSVLDDGPSWQLESDDDGLMWTAIGITGEGPVVIGERESFTVVVGLDSDGSLIWERAFDLGVGLTMREIAVAENGDILACGTRLLSPTTQPLDAPVVVKLGWGA